MNRRICINTFALLLAGVNASSIGIHGRRPRDIILDDGKGPLQDIVTWDEHSLFVHGERVVIFSGEVHPFRLPVPSLYLDVFQKIKALGFNTVSFYVDWGLLEGKPGKFRADGIFDLEPFFEAATKAGIYLLARPGPYINAEVSGGGFPGWLQRVKGHLRTDSPDYLHATDNYASHIASIIAKAQITNGGPVILYQPENEYSGAAEGTLFPNKPYLQYVIDQARNASIVVPLINNDAFPGGTGAPGTGLGSVDIYGFDGYPLGFDCAHPNTWPDNALPTTWHQDHLNISPNTPLSIVEFQGGAFDPFGGWGFEQCSALVNHEFERVFYKNNMAAGVTILNLYMTYGGTNWGNLGHPGGYTSYDYGASIREDRRVDREKYSELKLEGQFLKVSPGYITATPENATQGVYSDNPNIVITPLLAKESGSFFVVRHANYSSTDSASYTVKLPTSAGEVTIPQLGGSLTLNRRDSKFHVTDYPVGNFTLLYSSAEIFTWKKFADKTVLILYGGAQELHEVAVKNPFGSSKTTKAKKIEGSNVAIHTTKDLTLVLQWTVGSTRQVIQLGNLVIYMVDRNSAYNYWVPTLPGSGKQPAYGSSLMNPAAVIVNGGYLIRSVAVKGSTLSLQADFNVTTPLEVIGIPKGVSKLSVNGKQLDYSVSKLGDWIAHPAVEFPDIQLPNLSKLKWYKIDSLPEIQSRYDDSRWPLANLRTSNNTYAPLKTPVSLYGSDYGFNAGTLLFRGRFTAHTAQQQLFLSTQGGSAFASSVWLNDRFVGSFTGFDAASAANSSYTLNGLVRGRRYVLTVVVDSNGLDENWTTGDDSMKNPRGILDYALVSSSGSNVSISWKLTGNLGGEDYRDVFRGPLNEGGLFFERQGLHLPSPPLSDFTHGPSSSPLDGLSSAGIAFYAAKLPLDLPAHSYDIPLSFVFDNATTAAEGPYRALLYVNGFQYGKYVSNIGPQTEFPVPEGILHYNGDNWIGVALWALQGRGAKVPGLALKSKSPVLTGRERVDVVQGPGFKKRKGAY
ncbi:glycoside hydrolase family 35 protein [Trichoderma citrinoviride]|uniref:Beta-galactosidase n=1 Tax=Trichoderma citrinoviride TaxID=58853 RepID=A0A2T4AX48_9HYPO|nr:glycoside hydrolase family 35 protein [Trichoderma citrinoviride]PTB61654.1 glycoside hydrolase family 35 protein [Trichoderma citrinoviride]